MTLNGWGNSVNGNAIQTGDAAAPSSLTVTNSDTVLCPATPGTCATPGTSALVVQSKSPSNQGLTFTWAKGPSTTNSADFGDPTTTADYAVCLLCGLDPGERPGRSHGSAGSVPTGFLYNSKTAPVLQQMILAAGKTAGKAKIVARGKGSMGLPPSLPFQTATSVTVQVVNSQNTNCWGDTYGTFQISKNTPTQLKAKH